MHSTRSSRYWLSLAGCCLIFLLVACSSGGTLPPTGSSTPTGNKTATPGKTPTSGPTPTVTTAPVPPTQTSCPAEGTARAAVTAPLALGHEQNIVYLVTEFSGNSSTATLKRYDVTSGSKTEILKLAGKSIPEAQVSADGEWILFVAHMGQQDELQMVRMDGQGLQTLYCIANGRIQNVLWSSNQQLVLFSADISPQGFTGIYLLNLQKGTIQLELKPTKETNLGSAAALPFTWLDNTRAYVSFADYPIAPIDMLGLLDTSRGPNQQMKDITTVYQDKTSATYNYPCWDADSSYDGSTLFIGQCSGRSAPNCSGSCSLGTREGPSTIMTEPATGGSQKAIFSSQTLGIATVRSINSSTLLLQVENFSENHPVDTNQNGLWKVKTDGTGLTRLTTEVKGETTYLCQFTQNPWSNVSRDGSMYVFETSNSGSVTYPYTYTLSFGSLNGGTPQSFASIADGTRLEIVGWTTM